MSKKLYTARPWIASELGSFKRQESTFIVLNLSLLATLLFLHRFFASFWGNPSRSLVIAIAFVFGLKSIELVWLRRLSQPISPFSLVALTWASIVVNLALAILLGTLADHEDTPYFVLMVIPILEAAFRLGFVTVVGVVTVADLTTFFWVWRYYNRHPPLEISEYFEAGTTSLMFVIVGVVVWQLVRDLRHKEMRLASNLLELQRARERLVQEERLAAVGRLSSAIAHEIRNPVAMINSSIATAERLSGIEKEDMYKIASEEASRLVRLTTDFLTYARPRTPQLTVTSVADTLAYVADACRAHVSQQGVHIQVHAPEELTAEVDSGQVEQALINLIMNAADSSPSGSTIVLNAYAQDQAVCINVENTGSTISEPDLARIFEPFFTTKPHGTGLGLAIAKNIARVHGGDLVLSANGPQRICFSLILPISQETAVETGSLHG